MRSQPEAQSASNPRLLLGSLLAIPAAILCGAALAMALARIFTAHVGHDQSWGLYLGLQILHGVKLNGPELVEVNPPFLVWFMTLPVLFSHLLHLDVLNGFRCFYVAVLTLSACWAVFLFRKLYRPTPLGSWLFVLAVCCAGIYPVLQDDLGQREHMVSFLLLPYILAAAFRIRRERLGSAESCAIGLIAAVAICLKPQHLLEVVLIEGLVLYRLRSLRGWLHLTVCCLGFGLLLYYVAVRLTASAYLTDVVPLLTATYWGFNEPLAVVLRTAKRPIAVLLLDAILYLTLRSRIKIEALASVLLVSTTGALLAYVQQHKGWSYQVICLQVFGYLLLFLICGDFFQTWIVGRSLRSTFRVRPGYAGAAAAVTLLAGLAMLLHHPRLAAYTEDEKQTLAEVYGAYPKGTSVGLLSLDPWEFPAVIEQGKVWGSRYMHLWLLPAIVRSQDPEDREVEHHLTPQKIEELSTLLRTTTAQDLAHWQPKVVVVDPCGMIQICIPLAREHYGSLLGWFLRDAQFREEWSNYTYARTVGKLEVYQRKQ
jgi:hypothetical protein